MIKVLVGVTKTINKRKGDMRMVLYDYVEAKEIVLEWVMNKADCEELNDLIRDKEL